MKSFQRKALKGAWWLGSARVLRILTSFATLAVLSRHLTPAEFGIAGAIFFVTGLAQVFGDLGAKVALVQKEEITNIETQSVFWLNLSLAGLLMLTVILSSNQIVALFNIPELKSPLLWASPILLITGLQGVPSALLERRLEFNKLAIAEGMATLCGAITAVVMVLSGWGVGSLIAQGLVVATVTTIFLFFFARWKVRFQFGFYELLPLLRFGVYLSLAGVIRFMRDNAERPILASGISASSLGYFSIANQITMVPMRTIVTVVRRLITPIFSRIQNDGPRSRDAYLKVRYVLLLIMAPISFGMAAVSDVFVNVYLGDSWAPVAPLIAILAINVIFIALLDLDSSILIASAKVQIHFYWGLTTMAIFILSLLVAVRYGVVVVVLVRLALSVVSVPIYSSFVLRHLNVSWGIYFKGFITPLIASSGMYFAVTTILHGMEQVGDLWRLIIGVVAGLVVYPTILLALDRHGLMQLAQLFRLRTI